MYMYEYNRSIVKIVCFFASLLLFTPLVLYILKVNDVFPQRCPTEKKKELKQKEQEPSETDKKRKLEKTEKMKETIFIPNVTIPEVKPQFTGVELPSSQQTENESTQLCNDSMAEESNSEKKEPNRQVTQKPADDMGKISEISKKNETLIKNDNSASKISQSGTQEVIKRFDFEAYKNNLMRTANLQDGERMPVLELRDRYYRDGLWFYGYKKLVARPITLKGNPYYFILENNSLRIINEKCPYTGMYPPASREDYKLFESLLTDSHYSDTTKNSNFQLFYVPFDMKMAYVLQSKLKKIADTLAINMSDILIVRGNFEKINDAYLLLIESIHKNDGKVISVYDEDDLIIK